MQPHAIQSGSDPARPSPLHRFAQILAVLTFFLIGVGGLVTSTDSGLSVPDWPTTYGHNMFTFPLSQMVGGILYEHGHRLLASGVGFLTIVLAVWLSLREDRPVMKILGWGALAAVIIQGVLGGLTVKYFLPPAVSVSHAGLAKIFFCLTILIAFLTSPGWRNRKSHCMSSDQIRSVERFNRFMIATTALVYFQIILGAVMRHTYNDEQGFAIVGFPLSNGAWIPEFTDSVVAVHFAHRVNAFLILLGVLGILVFSWKRLREVSQLFRPSLFLGGLVLVQVCLGVATVLTEQGDPAAAEYTPVVSLTSSHQAVGALVLGTAFYLTLRTFQYLGNPSPSNSEGPETENDYAFQV